MEIKFEIKITNKSLYLNIYIYYYYTKEFEVN